MDRMVVGVGFGLVALLSACDDARQQMGGNSPIADASVHVAAPIEAVEGNARADSGASVEDPVEWAPSLDANVETPEETNELDAAGRAAEEMREPSPDADAQSTLEPPPAMVDAAIAEQALGKAYAEIEYKLEQPAALVDTYNVLLASTGDTRLFINEVRARQPGAEVLYGAADLIDGGLLWQMPPAAPRRFPVATSTENERTLVSTPFTYVLEARIQNPLDAGKSFRLQLKAEQTVWSATFSEDYERIVAGSLVGIVTRTETERLPLSLGALECLALCSDTAKCSSGIAKLSSLLDCNGAQLDADANGDGVLDGYRLVARFQSERISPPEQ